MAADRNPSSIGRLSLGGNALKGIAMTCDHIARTDIETYSQAEMSLQIVLHSVGRLTAPITLFFWPRTAAIPAVSGNI